ncbi:MAG: hypothetical protein ACXADH_05095 [Candidatus Kariarchaeaceae archaeon]|jgi:hypothetical protein
MDAIELYEHKQFASRRGANKKRKHTRFDKERKKRRENLPKWAKDGYPDYMNEAAYYDKQFPTEPRRKGHQRERDKSVLNKNKKRNNNPVKDRRKYWKPIRQDLGGKARW